MRLIRVLLHRLRSLLGRQSRETELDRELEIHLEQLTREYRQQGLDERAARLAARRDFGAVDLAKDECRDARRVNFVEDLGKDLVYAWRLAKKSPGFTLTAVASLALGIGANTVVFSSLNALVFHPLAVPDAERVFFVNNNGLPSNSHPNYRDIRDRNTVFEKLFAYRLVQVAVTEQQGARRLWGYLVTGNYFEGLGIAPAAGRLITYADDQKVNGHPVVVLSHACWQGRFNADPAIVGKTVRVNGLPYTVLGVAARGFHGVETMIHAEVFFPVAMQPQIEGRSWLEHRNSHNLWIAGRLKTGVTKERAEANLEAVAAQLAREHGKTDRLKLTLSPPGLLGAVLREPARAFGFGVMLLAALVLVAACANLASLLTARGAERERDLAIRVSIGAAGGRLVRQLLTESLAIALAGGAAGLALALLLLQWISLWRAPLEFPIQFDVMPDWRVFGFALMAALVTGVVFGLGPAVRAAGTDAAVAMKGVAPSARRRGWTFRDLLLPLQIALCCLLVTASLVAARGLARGLQTPLGFQPDGLAVAGLDVTMGGYSEQNGRAFLERALAEVSRLPGVESAAFASSIPLSIDQSNSRVYRDEETAFERKNSLVATNYYVTPGYFATVGTRLLAGREFLATDEAGKPPVAIVNATLARRLTGSSDAVGRRFRWGPKSAVEIVAVVEDGKYVTLPEQPESVIYFPARQMYSSSNVLLARTRRPAGEVAAEMRGVLQRLDPNLAAYGVGTARQMLGLAYLPMNAAVIALGAFGALALMLAVTGIYGIAAHSVARRSKEIGIRMAIGARPGQVLQFVFGRLSALIAVGAFAGLLAGVAASALLAVIVYQANARDPFVIVGAVLAIALVAFVAAFGPARRALRLNPVSSLRHD